MKQDLLADIASSLQRSATALETLIAERSARANSRWQQRMPVGPSPAAAVAALTWDDPFSEQVATADPPLATPVLVTVDANANPRLQVAILGQAQPPGQHAPGTPAFRYWVTAEALARGIAFWSSVMPQATTWSTHNPMRIDLLAGDDLNARYFRSAGLRFYRGRSGSTDVYTAESADIVCHELGHAILDALKPELFEQGQIEAAAFHEAFGDISAILCGLQLKSFRQVLLAETSGSIQVNSRLSRLGEQLGWAIRRKGVGSVEPDALRNAANRFFYRAPSQLPPDAPSDLLSQRPHSFSRIFTGAFLDALARMFKTHSAPDEAALKLTTEHAGRILANAILATPPNPAYFSQVAAGMVLAEQSLFGGRYREALTGAFNSRGILSTGSGMALTAAPGLRQAVPREAEAAGAAESVVLTMRGRAPDSGFMRGFGETPELPLQPIRLDGVALHVHLPQPGPAFAVKPSSYGMMGLEAVGSDAVDDAPHHGRLFLESLIARGELDAGPLSAKMPFGHKRGFGATHRVVEQDGSMVLKRLSFACDSS